jgi:hypothetical protein
MVVHVCNPSTQETEAGGSRVPERVGGQPELQSDTLSQKHTYFKNMNKTKKALHCQAPLAHIVILATQEAEIRKIEV